MYIQETCSFLELCSEAKLTTIFSRYITFLNLITPYVLVIYPHAINTYWNGNNNSSTIELPLLRKT